MTKINIRNIDIHSNGKTKNILSDSKIVVKNMKAANRIRNNILKLFCENKGIKDAEVFFIYEDYEHE